MKRSLLVLLIASASISARALEFDWGSSVPADRDAEWSVSYGAILDLSGHVDETFRAFYKATGQDYKQALAESYSLDDFDLDDTYETFGLHYRKQGKNFAFRWDFLYLGLEADPTAKRDYYIGLGDSVSYGGKDYDHMKIPKGSSFSIDFAGGMMSFLGAWTPFTIYFADDLRLTPELDLGLVLIGGDYEVDAGKARGTAVYQNPPVDFVVGGKSSSVIGAGAPMIGIGGELRLGADDWIQWVTHASLGYFTFSGDTEIFTGSSRAKDLDLDYFSLSIDSAVILPMTETTCLTLGARLEYMQLEGSVKSKAKDTAAVISARERFDKDFDFKTVAAVLYAGITF